MSFKHFANPASKAVCTLYTFNTFITVYIDVKRREIVAAADICPNKTYSNVCFERYTWYLNV